jgi:hypothetical protein
MVTLFVWIIKCNKLGLAAQVIVDADNFRWSEFKFLNLTLIVPRFVTTRNDHWPAKWGHKSSINLHILHYHLKLLAYHVPAAAPMLTGAQRRKQIHRASMTRLKASIFQIMSCCYTILASSSARVPFSLGN